MNLFPKFLLAINLCTPIFIQAMKRERAIEFLDQYIPITKRPKPCYEKYFKAIASNDIKTFKLFNSFFGVAINTANSFNQTALSIAAHKGSIKIVKSALQARANINKAEAGGSTPLHLAALAGHNEIVELLLAHATINKIDIVNVANDLGITPLQYAINQNRIGIIALLLKSGADVNKTYQHSFETPLYCAASKGNMSIVKILVEQHNAIISSKDIIVARRNSHEEIENYLKQNQTGCCRLLCR